MTRSGACIIVWDDAQAIELGEALKRRSWCALVLKPSVPLCTPLSGPTNLVVVDADMQAAYRAVLDEVDPTVTDIIALSKSSATPRLMTLANENVSLFVEKPIDVELLAEAITLSSYKNNDQSSDKPRVLTMKQNDSGPADGQGRRG